MKVLVACEESQTVCKAFRERGHEAYSCDMQEPSGGHPEWHVCGDASALLSGGGITTMDGATHYIDRWDLLIAHPPCTYLTNAGARHLWKDHQLQPERVKLGIMARDLFMRFWWADIPRIVIENPVPSSIFCLPEYTQIINPHQFYGADHPYTKKNVFVGKGCGTVSAGRSGRTGEKQSASYEEWHSPPLLLGNGSEQRPGENEK